MSRQKNTTTAPTPSGFWDSPLLRSRIRTPRVTWFETLVGFFLGPFGVLVFNAVLVGYINVYFTDVLGISGTFLVVFPIVSSLLAVAVNLAMGVVIDHTRTPAGKARPYILLAAPLLLAAGILLYTMPASMPSSVAQMAWIVVAYNLYLSVANSIYSMGHSLMVPLATRDGESRSRLSVWTNTASSGAIGFVSIAFPVALSFIGASRGRWASVMCVLAGVAAAGAVVEYYYTRERITEEMSSASAERERPVPVRRQLKALLTEPYWWIIIVFYVLWQFSGTMKNGSMTYFCNYIVGTYADGTTQTVLAVIGAVPMAAGMFVSWPLANQFGKRNFTIAGLLIGVAGGLIMWIAPTDIRVVSVGLVVKSIGMIPGMTIMTALFSDVLDHMEFRNGFRCDGLSMSIYSACMTTLSGLCSGVMNLMLNASGYIAPNADAATVTTGVQKIVDGTAIYDQPGSAQFAIKAMYILFELVAWAVAAVALTGLDVERNLPAEQEEIRRRREAGMAGAEAEGYTS